MADRPYTLLSSCMSLDGYLDDAAAQRLELSNPADFDRIDAVRAGCDAILVGANTIRADNPRLLVKSPARGADRLALGQSASPLKVTLTRTGDLDPDAAFFVAGDDTQDVPLVYCPDPVAESVRLRLGARAEVVGTGPQVDLMALLEDLSDRGVNRLLVEGGGAVNTQLLAAGLVDQLDLVVAPFFVGDALAPRFVEPGRFPWTAGRRATLVDAQPIGDVVLMRYALTDRFGAS